MSSMLPQLEHRVQELEQLAVEVYDLAERLSKGENTQPELSIKGQQWYRGVRELMVQNAFSGQNELEDCYKHYAQRDIPNMAHLRSSGDIETYFSTEGPDAGSNFHVFKRLFMKARSLVGALEAEALSRELPVKSQLSLMVSASELETAENILRESKGDEVLMRAAGVIARVALERHLFTVAETRKLTIAKNPPNKKHPDVENVEQTLQKNSIVSAIQKSQFDSLFKVANNCAHPKETVNYADVERLIREGKQLASVIV